MNSKVLKNFFVIEGIDGAGTTTQTKLIESIHKKNYIKVDTSFEPTDSPVGKLIRKFLKAEHKADDLTIAMLFSADRSYHIFGENGIIQKTKNGIKCFSDRYLFSSLAYQSKNLDIKKIYTLNEEFPLPEILFFIDIDEKIALSRIEKRECEKEIYENLEYLKSVRKSYLKAIKSYKETKMKVVIIDGTLSIEEIHKIICNNLKYLNTCR